MQGAPITGTVPEEWPDKDTASDESAVGDPGIFFCTTEKGQQSKLKQ